ncbi:type VI secretion system lipoprotein TssJ [Pseudomonas thivervalensis]|uniref:Type VI secretion system-associated lipoprotein n=1 Tax=Pseudomonas thivervalensis TaxID=86265 RepID=A0A2Z5A0K7_9PSED|nr:type VI secretion system lipoprotein TssJ [Pseudomonas thivervalensis]AXA58041.1 type VI secretion system-associated lipoprotein [Pseudomonas thivervalensis]AXA63753.1 type VI secretion system-associated lipoprotein [Pseudomonas thivervalensis]
MSHCTTHLSKFLTALAMTLLLIGCTTLSPFSTMTKLNLTLTASDQLNPDLNGRPSPVVVRLFELKHPVAFENADFFSLYERERETLTPDLVAGEELELRPGETVELKLGISGDGRYVGVLAAYRDLPHTRWRYTLPVAATQLTEVNLTLDGDGIVNTLERLAKVDDR